jgi:hypothetical protein
VGQALSIFLKGEYPVNGGASDPMPRFVILEHDHPELHWDFMLEAGPVLRTWRLASPPELGRVVAVTPSFDHRPMYLDYEGPVSGGRGQVRRWEYGEFTWESDAPERLIVWLDGQRLRGRSVFSRAESGAWSLVVEAHGQDC